MKYIIVISFLFVLFGVSCSKKEKKTVGKTEWHIELMMSIDDSSFLMPYVYIDKYSCIHVTKYCNILDSVYQINFVDTMNLNGTMYNYYCAKCINNKRFEHICRIVDRNEKSCLQN